MGGIGTGGPATAAIAAPGVVVATLVGVAVFLRGHFQRYGRISGWPGQVTLLVVLTAVGLVAYAVWPLPRGADGLCGPEGGAPARFAPLGTLQPFTGPALAHASIALGVLVPAGLLARYRYRRGVLLTVGLGTALALLVEVVQLSALIGMYPCPYRVAAVDDVVLGGIGALVGWLVGLAASRVAPRGWPAAVVDIMPPVLSRRVLGYALDLAMWWYGASVIGTAAVAAGLVTPSWLGATRSVALVALALLLGLVVPMFRRDRSAPGRVAVHLALSEVGAPRPAARLRILLRSALLYGPVVALFALGLPWWSLVVAVLHGLPVLVRRDQSGLADLVAGVRVVTRTAVRGGLPDHLVRYVAPPVSPSADTPTPHR